MVTINTKNDFPIERKPVAGPVVTKPIPQSGIKTSNPMGKGENSSSVMG